LQRSRVSVVVPAHDAAPFLRAALDGLLVELPEDGEVIVVDDGSQDETSAILERYRPRIRVLRHEIAVGPGPARNQGAALASGDVLAFHDADDLVLPGRLRRLVPLLEGDPTIDLVFGNGTLVDEGGRNLGAVVPRRYARRLRRRTGPRELLGGSFVYPQALCVRRRVFEDLGGFGAGMVRGELRTGVAEDWELALRAALRCEMRFVDLPVFAYRRHAASVTERAAADCAAANLAMLEDLVARHPEIVARAGRDAVEDALARRLARLARHLEHAGGIAEARAALDRAIGLRPRSLRLRWRRRRLARPA
jgi:glycosyltransferase involved in cell wall biosynthesis